MKKELDQEWVLRLTIDKKPIRIENGKVVYENNPRKVRYIVFDQHRDAPVGFGVKVGTDSKTYIIQRRVPGGKVIKAKIGHVRDFGEISDARLEAKKFFDTIKKTGLNPNEVARQKSASEITLGGVFGEYRAHLVGRSQPAKLNTLIALDKAMKRLSEWEGKYIRDLSTLQIITKFDEMASKTPTTAEQTFRWAISATSHVIGVEAHEANSAKREPTLTHNPFTILSINKKFRSRAQLDEDYKKKGIRNPLSATETMGRFLNALWDRRKSNRTGCDYLLLMLLWGCRRSEHACIQWRELLNKQDMIQSSWVDLKRGRVFFYDTKNRRSHELPLTKAVRELLIQRQELAAECAEKKGHSKKSMWVFPAESPFSKSGHYSDASSLLKYIRDDAKIEKLAPHDLRRSLGRIAEDVGTPYGVIKRLLNHKDKDVTAAYTESEWRRLRDRMQRIEDAVLITAPRVYNALRDLSSPAIMETGGVENKHED